MARDEASLLRSQFLLDVKAQFSLGRRGWPGELVEFEEEQGASVLDESLEVLRHVGRGHELFVYQTLTIWGDQVATYAVRESVRKRRFRLMLRIREFPLSASPASIVATYWWASDQLKQLSVPPGGTRDDRALLRDIETRWLELSGSASH